MFDVTIKIATCKCVAIKCCEKSLKLKQQKI